MDTFYQGTWRMDWGLGNPNKTAALIAGLMIAVWALAAIRKWGFWASLLLFTTLGGAMLHTFSRGGLVAALAGLLPVIFFAAKPWSRGKILAVAGSLAILAAYGFHLKAVNRYAGGLLEEDKSVTNRLELWKTAPAMMVDAPGGWGFGNSGTAYMQWYQPLDRSEGYRTLVNSHLTWLVEFGWPVRFLYLMGWVLIFCLCWPAAKHRYLMAIGWGCWLTLAVSCAFSSVGESPWVWLVPAVAFSTILYLRRTSKAWPVLPAWLAAVAAAVSGTLGLYVIGTATDPHTVSYRDGVVFLGRGPLVCWIVPNEDVFGKYFGPYLRRAFQGDLVEKSVAVSKQLPKSQGIHQPFLLVTGNLREADTKDAGLKTWLQDRNALVLINPMIYPSQLQGGTDKPFVYNVWLGQFSNIPGALSWKDCEGITLKVFDGIGDYSSDWFYIIRLETKKL